MIPAFFMDVYRALQSSSVRQGVLVSAALVDDDSKATRSSTIFFMISVLQLCYRMMKRW